MKIRIIAAALAAFFMLPVFGMVAYAGGGDNTQPELPVIVQPAPPEAPPVPATEGHVIAEPEVNPFTPTGTGTVIDNATDADGKEFYTIMTPNENVFFLVIDKQRGQDNVYFLNAVTEADLMALAEVPPVPEPEPVEQAPVPMPEPESMPEKGGGMGTLLLVVLIVIIGGGAGYYLKIYRPKQQQADNGDEYEAGEEYEADEPDPYGVDDYGAELAEGDYLWDDGYDGGGDGDE